MPETSVIHMFSTECGTIVNKFDKKCCKIVNDMLYCACEDISPRIFGVGRGRISLVEVCHP